MSEYVLTVSANASVWASLDQFTKGYIEAAMWLLTDDDGNDCDEMTFEDIDPDALAKVIADCLLFQTAHRVDLDAATEEDGSREDAHHGHDFYLTRNHHGAGFWDRGYTPALGRILTDAAHACGEDNWYVGDDGRVYRE